MIKTFLYTIIYPLTRELFAFQKDGCALTNRTNLSVIRDGPPWIDLGVAKKNSITIMRLPRWKRLIARSEALKSDLIFWLCLQVTRSYKFCMAPLTCCAIPNQCLWAPLHWSEEAPAIPGDFPIAVGPLRQKSTQRHSTAREKLSTPDWRRIVSSSDSQS